MKITAIPWTFLSVLGLTMTLVTGYLIVRGPFLGGPSLDPFSILVAAGVFIAGIVVLTLGGSKLTRLYTRF